MSLPNLFQVNWLAGQNKLEANSLAKRESPKLNELYWTFYSFCISISFVLFHITFPFTIREGGREGGCTIFFALVFLRKKDFFFLLYFKYIFPLAVAREGVMHSFVAWRWTFNMDKRTENANEIYGNKQCASYKSYQWQLHWNIWAFGAGASGLDS